MKNSDVFPHKPRLRSFWPLMSHLSRTMLKSNYPVAALALGGTIVLASPALAQDAADRTLLATFCDAGNIKGDTCSHAKGYPASGKRNCEVKLLKDRFTG